MVYLKRVLLCWMWLAAMVVQPVLAEPGIALSGFLSVVGGKVSGGSLQGPWPANPDVTCPCYIADYANFGTYGPDLSFSPESRVGLQAVATLTDQLSATAQLTARGTDGTPQLQWAYLTYALSPSWDLQAGRQRIPLYFYSSFQDVGVAYPWIAPPPELYGWEATNYNGASLRNRTSFGDVYMNTSVFAGSEEVKDSRFMRASGQYRTDVRWKNIVGGDVELVKDQLTVRANYMQADTVFTDKDDSVNDYSETMRAYGIAANLDFNQWFILSEFNTNVRDNKTGSIAGVTITIPTITVGVGARFGSWTPFLNFSRYTERSSDELIYPSFAMRRTSFTLRYEVSPSSAIKAQVDHYWEPGDAYAGSANVVRISYDRVF